jgi:hypothetical protein
MYTAQETKIVSSAVAMADMIVWQALLQVFFFMSIE